MPDERDPSRHRRTGCRARSPSIVPTRATRSPPSMRDALTDTFDELSATLGVRAIVLTGAGERHFCTGAGLGGAQPPPPERPEGAPERSVGDVARLIRRGWQRLIASILDCEKPVVAAVNGTAAGGGANLVLACDLVVMADSARLIEVFVRRGIIPDAGAAYLLPRIVGLAAGEGAPVPRRRPVRRRLRAVGHRQPCRPARRGGGDRGRPGRAVGGRPVEGDRHDEVARQPQLGVRAGTRPSRRRPTPRSS